MQIYHGKSVSGGIAIGKLHVFSPKEQQVERIEIADTAAEKMRFAKAEITAKEQLKVLYERTCREAGKAEAAIFEGHRMLLEDDDFRNRVNNIIATQRVNAEYAVKITAKKLEEKFLSFGDEVLRERAADIRDVAGRLISILSKEVKEDFVAEEPGIVLAQDLLPSQLVRLDKGKLCSLVMVQGSLNSHTAILAETMGILTLVDTGVFLSRELEGKEAIVDGFEGILYIEPAQEIKNALLEKKAKAEKEKQLLSDLKGKEEVTRDGRQMMLYANIGSEKDLPGVLQNDARGIGLFRSEFLYLKSGDFPTEEEQFQVYKSVAETMAGKRVVIRTLDVGADKKPDYFPMQAEKNPALGYRGIRICLSRPEIFKTQLRAILRAGVYGNMALLYPMITSVTEVRRIKEMVNEAKEELKERGMIYADMPQGVMIETPAAVMISEELAKEVDFFSIGTNDLTQYALAYDRQNPGLEEFFDPHHPAILRMIRMTVENAHKAGIRVEICGELGADLALTGEFIRMGVDALSVAAENILPLRKIIREMVRD